MMTMQRRGEKVERYGGEYNNRCAEQDGYRGARPYRCCNDDQQPTGRWTAKVKHRAERLGQRGGRPRWVGRRGGRPRMRAVVLALAILLVVPLLTSCDGKYGLTLPDSVEHGSVSTPRPADHRYDDDEEVALSFTPDEGNTFMATSPGTALVTATVAGGTTAGAGDYTQDFSITVVPTAVVTYGVSVASGSGDGEYAAGDTVTLVADAAATGMRFKEWTVSPSVTFTEGGATTSVARFTMPAGAVSATATYETGSTPVVGTPMFSPAAGTYTSAQTVSLSSDTPGATICYTTDGSDPTFASSAYSTPITVSNTTTIKARAFTDSTTASEMASATYTIATSPTPVLTHYPVTSGADSAWTRGTKAHRDSMIISCDVGYDHFTGFAVDGALISTAYYDVWSGSTIVKPKKAYLDTLAPGTHTVRLVYPDGYAETTLTVYDAAAGSVPATGDTVVFGGLGAGTGAFGARGVLWASAELLACGTVLVAVGGITARQRKRRRARVR